MFMAVVLYEGIWHGKIGSEGIQQEECLLGRILLRRNQACEGPVERECQIRGVRLRETTHRDEYVLETSVYIPNLSPTKFGNERCEYRPRIFKSPSPGCSTANCGCGNTWQAPMPVLWTAVRDGLPISVTSRLNFLLPLCHNSAPMSHRHEADIHHSISTDCWLRFDGAKVVGYSLRPADTKVVAGCHSGPTDGGGVGPL
jgi:hypothetical protein